MHTHCRSRSSAGRLQILTFSAAVSLCIHNLGKESVMKADQTISTIFRQLRPSLCQPHPASSRLRPLSQLAPLRNPSFPCPAHPPKGGIPPPFPAIRSRQTRRVSDSTSAPSSAVAHPPDFLGNTQSPPEKPPAYELTFTCKPCKHRSTHTVSKQGYHKGTVLITCPECSNRHVMSDHLKVGFQSLCVVDTKSKSEGCGY